MKFACPDLKNYRGGNKRALRNLDLGMWIKTKRTPDIASSEITPEGAYMNRRRFIEVAAGLPIAAPSASAWAQTMSALIKRLEPASQAK